MITFVVFAFMLGIDVYWFGRLRLLLGGSKSIFLKQSVFYGFWGLSFLMMGFWFWYRFGDILTLPIHIRGAFSSVMIALYITKFFTALPFFAEDFFLGIKFLFFTLKSCFKNFVKKIFSQKANKNVEEQAKKQENLPQNPTENINLTRSEFLVKTALLASSIPFGLLSYGMAWGVNDFQVRKKNIKIPNLSKKWHGLQIAHISDMHVGSYLDDKALKKGIDLLKSQKPDVICFTGDLVNQYTDEINPFFHALSQLKAPLGVVSSLGNHDYGDYYQWNTMAEKAKNLQKMYQAHKQLGWKLLIDEVFFLEEDNEKLAFLGVGNWSASSRFPQYGNLPKAYQKAENQAQNKILLSHDPSHWDAQIRQYADINLTLAGHTHGMQLGIEIGDFKWSPSKYIYEQWAGLYEKNGQQIYVNRGFGYSQAMPARIGILPEITILTIEG